MKRISFEDRQTIERLLKTNTSIATIAKEIGVHRDTIYKELKRCNATPITYSADLAQKSL